MYAEAFIFVILSSSFSVSIILQQEPDFPILSFLTYWSEADSKKDIGTWDFGTSREIIEENNINSGSRMIQAQAGRKLHLNCHSNMHHPPHRHLQWYYLPCGSSHNQTPCKVLKSELTTDTEWRLVQNQNHMDELILEVPTWMDSGLYKCSTIRHDRTFKVVRMFHLEIIDGTTQQPEIVEGPWDVSIPCCEGDQKASLQCRVRSSIQPNILWFRKFSVSSGISGENIIIYRDAGWKMLPSNQIHLGDQLYLSKLSFDQPTTEDTGYYACLAINYKGWIMQGSQLTVYTQPSLAPLNRSGRDEEWGGFRFSGLFLIPVCLALIPASVWLCYLYHKLRNKQKVPFIS